MNNQASFKLSPYHQLNQEQSLLVQKILHFSITHCSNKNHPAVFTIYGEAGTGKSVVLSALFDQLQKLNHQTGSQLYKTQNYFLVNHPELLKVYKQIAGPIKELYKKNYMRPTSFINQMDKKQTSADVVVIDEAHLLLSQPDHYNNFYHDNQLEEVIKRSKVIILVFDENQVLRMKSFWTRKRLEAITHHYPYEDYQLHHQFRMMAPDSLIEWFNFFTHNKLMPLKKEMWHNYDFRIFTDAEKMRQEIVKRNQTDGLARILSTSGYPSTLDGGKHYIKEGKFMLPWDQYNYTSTPWAEIPTTISLIPRTNQLKVNLDKITDVEMFKKRNDLTNSKEKIEYEEKMVMNSLNVLFKRGIRGTYLYAHDPALRAKLAALFQQAS